MKKTILKTAAFCLAVSLNFTGCGPKYENGIHTTSDNMREKNSKTKVYYEDVNEPKIKENISSIAKYLNSGSLKTDYMIASCSNTEKENYDDFLKELKEKKNDIGYTFTTNTYVEMNRNYITVNKTYSTKNEIYKDYLDIFWALHYATTNNAALKDEFGTSPQLILDEDALKQYKLSFTILRESIRNSIANDVKRQIEQGGWQMVNNPKDADKEIYFELTRDYRQSELKQMKEKGTGVNYSVVSSGSDNTNVMNSTMSSVSRSNNASTSIAAGVGAGLALDIIAGAFEPKVDKAIVFPSMKIVNNSNKTAYLQLFEMGLLSNNKMETINFLARINNGMNRFNEGKLFEQIPLDYKK